MTSVSFTTRLVSDSRVGGLATVYAAVAPPPLHARTPSKQRVRFATRKLRRVLLRCLIAAAIDPRSHLDADAKALIMHNPRRSGSEDSIGTWEDGLRAIEEYDWGDPPADYMGDGLERTCLDVNAPAPTLPDVSASVSTGDLDSRRPSLAVSGSHVSEAQTPATHYSLVHPETPALETSEVEDTLIDNDVEESLTHNTTALSPPVERQLLAGLEEAAAAVAPLGGHEGQSADHRESVAEAMEVPDLPDIGGILTPVLQSTPVQAFSAPPEQVSDPAGSAADFNRLSPSPLKTDITGTLHHVQEDIPFQEESKAAPTTLLEDIEINHDHDVKPSLKSPEVLPNGPHCFNDADCPPTTPEVKLDHEKGIIPAMDAMASKLFPDKHNRNAHSTALPLKHEEDHKDSFSLKINSPLARLSSPHEVHPEIGYQAPSTIGASTMSDIGALVSKEKDEKTASALEPVPSINLTIQTVSRPPSLVCPAPAESVLAESFAPYSSGAEISDTNDIQHEVIDSADSLRGVIDHGSSERASSIDVQPQPTTPSSELPEPSATNPVNVTVDTNAILNVHLPIRINTTVTLLSAEIDPGLGLVDAGHGGEDASMPDRDSIDLDPVESLGWVPLLPPSEPIDSKPAPAPVAVIANPGEIHVVSTGAPESLSSVHLPAPFSDWEDMRSARAQRGSPVDIHYLSDEPDTASDKSGSDHGIAAEAESPVMLPSADIGENAELAGPFEVSVESSNMNPADVGNAMEGGPEDASKTKVPPVPPDVPEADSAPVSVELSHEDQPPTALLLSEMLQALNEPAPHSTVPEAIPRPTSEPSPTMEEPPDCEEEAVTSPEVVAARTQSPEPLQKEVALAAPSLISHDLSSELSDPPEEEESPVSPAGATPRVDPSTGKANAHGHLQYIKPRWDPVGQVIKEGVESLFDKRVYKRDHVTQYRVKFTGRSNKYSRWINAAILEEVVPDLVKQYEAAEAKRASQAPLLSVNTVESAAATPSSLQEPASAQTAVPENPTPFTPSVTAKPRSKFGLKRKQAPKNPLSSCRKEKTYRPVASDSDVEPPPKKARKGRRASSGTKTTKPKGKASRLSLDGADTSDSEIEAKAGKDKLEDGENTGDAPPSQSRSLTPSDLEVKYGKRATRSETNMEMAKSDHTSPIAPVAITTPAPAAEKSSKAKKVATTSAKRKGALQGEAVTPSRKRHTRRVSELMEAERNIGKRLRSAKKG